MRQHHSVNRVEDPALRDGFWHVEVTVSAPNSRRLKVKIDAKTGKIEGVEQR